MTSTRMAWALGMVVAVGCGGSGETGTGGAGTTASSSSGGGGASSSSTATSSSTTSSSTSSSSTTGGPTYDPSGFSCSGANPSWANEVSPILAANCATEGCHTPLKMAGPGWGFLRGAGGVGIIAEQCADLRLFVAPSDPERSYVIHKVTDHNICMGKTMPKDAAMLAAADTQVVYDWICNGAANN